MFEQPLLASIFLQPEVIHDLKLKPFHFKNMEYRLIFEAMLLLVEKKIAIDVLTVKEVMPDYSVDKLFSLVTLLPSANMVHVYEKRIMEEYKRGELAKLALLLNDIQDVSETVVQLQGKIEEITADENHLDQREKMLAYTESLDNPIDCIITPYEKLNLMTGGGLPYGELVILAARPGVGKTAMAVDFALANMGHVMFISLEMSYNQLANRIMSNKYQLDSYAIKRRNEVAITKIIHNLYLLNDIIIDDTAGQSLPDIRMKVKSAKRSKQINLVIIDYLGLMLTHTDGNRNEQISAITRGLKLMAKEMNICILCLSQLNRQFSQRSSPEPILSDLRDSGSIEQDAADVLFIHRNKDDQEVLSNDTKLIVAKQREGATGTIKLLFKGQFTKFVEV